MSQYTTEVRWICEQKNANKQAKSVDEIIEGSLANVFNFDFPIFDEYYRNILEHKILKHYYTREIGLETVGLWQLKLNTKLNEIMPYYNQLYLSTLMEFNPLYTVDLTRRHEKKNENEEKNDNRTDGTTANTLGSTRTSENTTTGDSTDRYSDTPQGSLQNFVNNEYLTNARIINNNGHGVEGVTYGQNESGTSSSVFGGKIKGTGTEEYLETVKGYQGWSPNKLLKEFRDNILNVDLMIIKELSDLFFNLW